MLSLYEILKASKTGIAPDMWTALAGMNWGGAHEVKELTGIPPLSIRSNGTPLLDYLISGNTVQNDTPSPSNPVDVNGVGERTENLFDDHNVINIPGVGYRYGTILPNGTYSIYNGTNNTMYYGVNNWLGRFEACSPHSTATITISNNSGTVGGVFMPLDSASQGGCTVIEGSTPPSNYFPYGYKIPISNGQQTTNIYLGSTQTTRQIKKLVLDGTENWQGSDTSPTKNLTLEGYAKISGISCVSTHYNPANNVVSGGPIPYDSCCFYIGASNVVYLKGNESDTYPKTITDFKAYLAQQYANGTPVTIWYVLATAETATVNEPLMKIGDYADTVSYEQAGVQIPTLHGNTVIDVETTPKPSQMYIKYQK